MDYGEYICEIIGIAAVGGLAVGGAIAAQLSGKREKNILNQEKKKLIQARASSPDTKSRKIFDKKIEMIDQKIATNTKRTAVKTAIGAVPGAGIVSVARLHNRDAADRKREQEDTMKQLRLKMNDCQTPECRSVINQQIATLNQKKSRIST